MSRCAIKARSFIAAHASGMSWASRQRASTMPSSIAMLAPCARKGSVGWQASPSRLTRPDRPDVRAVRGRASPDLYRTSIASTLPAVSVPRGEIPTAFLDRSRLRPTSISQSSRSIAGDKSRQLPGAAVGDDGPRGPIHVVPYCWRSRGGRHSSERPRSGHEAGEKWHIRPRIAGEQQIFECTPSAPISASPLRRSPFSRRRDVTPFASCSKPHAAAPTCTASGALASQVLRQRGVEIAAMDQPIRRAVGASLGVGTMTCTRQAWRY